MIVLIFNSILLGLGLAMDAFSVSLADGLSEHKMKSGRMCLIAGTFAAFQFIMPLIGWFCIHCLAEAFTVIYTYVPFVACALLFFIGGKMVLEGVRDTLDKKEAAANGQEIQPEAADKKITLNTLVVQGIATSIDALSVGFTIASYSALKALVSSLIIGVVTFAVCIAGIIIGKKVGTKYAEKSAIFGGCVLIAIGLEQLITGIVAII